MKNKNSFILGTLLGSAIGFGIGLVWKNKKDKFDTLDINLDGIDDYDFGFIPDDFKLPEDFDEMFYNQIYDTDDDIYIPSENFIEINKEKSDGSKDDIEDKVEKSKVKVGKKITDVDKKVKKVKDKIKKEVKKDKKEVENKTKDVKKEVSKGTKKVKKDIKNTVKDTKDSVDNIADDVK